jgi:DNA-binding response OmpR family regulator
MLKVLIADDEPALLHLLKTNLELDGYATFVATNGADALAIVEAERPDIVLLDVMMPVLDGWEVLTYLARSELGTRVILITAKAQESAQLHGWELGCDEYITKPFDLEELLRRVDEVAVRSPEDTARRRAEAVAELKAPAAR